MSQSTSTSSGLGYKHSTLQDTFRIVSEQSTSRPGCVIELDSISDATHDWQNTQLLHVFQEQLISSSPQGKNLREASNISLVQPDLQAIVDLRHSSVFEEPFYLVILEKQEDKSVLHMWKIVIASPFGAEDHEQNSFAYVPDSNIVQESDHSNQSSRSMTPDHNHDASYPLSQVSPLRISTKKVCAQIMPLPEDVEIVHATPAAGHLSSSNIYPACFAPYLICTACSDYSVR
ncbi:dmX-like protein 2 [Nephila pilipes]|uniref:DmX-like protein 2 n=1 Tax=Nephila pilipes TaxID=299642 RepID=A0A8X6Q1S5_NEPPI|nr:dmX-like protein 2 [Nephila pilipes]GFU01801.1 dmX-like protein 2 [Nephila pilipes]